MTPQGCDITGQRPGVRHAVCTDSNEHRRDIARPEVKDSVLYLRCPGDDLEAAVFGLERRVELGLTRERARHDHAERVAAGVGDGCHFALPATTEPKVAELFALSRGFFTGRSWSDQSPLFRV